MNITRMIIESGKKPDEIKAALMKAMEWDDDIPLHLGAVLKYLCQEGVGQADAAEIGLYLTLEGLLN